jgi:hypothetical protein
MLSPVALPPAIASLKVIICADLAIPCVLENRTVPDINKEQVSRHGQ